MAARRLCDPRRLGRLLSLQVLGRARARPRRRSVGAFDAGRIHPDPAGAAQPPRPGPRDPLQRPGELPANRVLMSAVEKVAFGLFLVCTVALFVWVAVLVIRKLVYGSLHRPAKLRSRT